MSTGPETLSHRSSENLGREEKDDEGRETHGKAQAVFQQCLPATIKPSHALINYSGAHKHFATFFLQPPLHANSHYADICNICTYGTLAVVVSDMEPKFVSLQA